MEEVRIRVWCDAEQRWFGELACRRESESKMEFRSKDSFLTFDDAMFWLLEKYQNVKGGGENAG